MSQISDSSRCEWPLRHHWPGPLPRVLNAIDCPSGDGAAANSFVKRSAVTGIGMPPARGPDRCR